MRGHRLLKQPTILLGLEKIDKIGGFKISLKFWGVQMQSIWRVHFVGGFSFAGGLVAKWVEILEFKLRHFYWFYFK